MQLLQPHTGKQLGITVEGVEFDRFPIRTSVVMPTDSLDAIIDTYARPHLCSGDTLAISERIVAITQGRAYPLADIVPRPLAKLLVRFVHKSKHGIGLGSPWTMELALREAGTLRILLASFFAAITKPFGLRGVFYHIAGRGVAAIDGPCDYTLPPYNGYAKLGPKDPDGVAARLATRLSCDIIVIDANDLGVNILGKSPSARPRKFYEALFADNPLGQTTEQTPMAIIRRRA
jgi:F420-0:gamma-glutamyl ligase-like protein